MSLDGYVAGPNQSEEHPLGEGGEALHEWALALRAWREPHGQQGGEDNASTPVMAEMLADVGAVVMGRNMFGPFRGAWDEHSWDGWWGDEPPYHAPVFVLTHHEREPLEMQGGTTFHFVTDGVEAAIARATEAAGDDDVLVAGGASAARATRPRRSTSRRTSARSSPSARYEFPARACRGHARAGRRRAPCR